MKKILQKEEEVLHQVAKEIPLDEIKTPKIQKILKEMSDSLKSQDDGVAIAAPQIGYSLRIFVVSGKIFEEDFLENRKERMDGEKETKEVIKVKQKIKDLVFINPKISKLSKDKEWMPEGCLSVRPIYGKTYRSKKATVEAYDETGKKFIRGGSNLLAQIFQHETDHLEGILFIDHAKDLREEEIPGYEKE
ncbi:MAG: peptide deformylase [Patescibacteria group bacterium]